MAQRLFPTIIPSHYAISLQPDLQTFTVRGEETITFITNQPSSSLVFHAYQITVKKALLRFKDTEISPKEITCDDTKKTVTFVFAEEVPSGEKTLDLTFDGVLSYKAKGFYKSKYEVNGKVQYMAVTQFEEIGARQAFVCIDDPSAKAIFSISLVVDEKLTAISNTKEVSEEKIEGGLKKITFEPTPRMSTYILAFVVGELVYKEVIADGIRIRTYTTEGKKELTAFALAVAPKVLAFFNDYFDIPYPLTKLDLLAIPDFDAGAMENWGAVTFRESILLIDEKKSSWANKQWSALVIAHELAHMWFGNLVTMEWWTHLWLNEGFACYIEYLCINKLFPEWELWKQFALIEHNDALKLDGLKFTHPIETPIASDQEVKEIFDEISYAKGANVIHMIASFLGEDVFRDGLRFYLKKHTYQNAQTEDLWTALEEVSQKPVGKIMNTWTKKPGYPLLQVTEKGESLEITQSRFFSNPQSKEEEHTLWNIPMRLASSASLQTQPYQIEKATTTLPQKGLWTKINAGETALVRTLYTESLYRTLKDPIEMKSLSAIDRMGIIRDAFDSAEAGLLSSREAIQLLSYYTNEDDYIVWTTIAGQIGSLENIIAHIDGVDEAFRKYAMRIFTPIARKMGWEKKRGESHTDILLRSMALHAAGKYGDKQTIAKARELFTYFTEKKVAIDSDIRGAVFTIFAEHGGESEWKALIALHEKEQLQQEKNRYMLALTQFKNPDLLHNTIEYLLTDAVRWQDKSRWLMAVFGNEKGQDMAWDFVKKHWSLFEKEYKGLHGFTRVIEGAGSMVGKEALADVRHFFAQHPTEELQRTMNQVLEKIELNTAWLERDKEKLREFFNQLPKDDSVT